MSQESALDLLLNRLRCEQQPSLWIADEHVAAIREIPANPAIEVISNRFDVANQLSNQGWNSHFSDLDISHINDKSLASLYFRIAKEKPLVNHVINQASRVLKAGGRLIICGEKQQGIKSYAKKAATCLAGTVEIKKYGQNYLATIIRSQQPALLLDDKEYPTVRITQHYNGIDISSKPGQFGWDKLDKGSLLLAEYFNQKQTSQPKSILDLGCGYGFLSLAAHQQWPNAKITATDNNAAALISCQQNFAQHAVSGEVIAANCAENIRKKYDLVLCNPPFHQGFSVEGDLTEQFISTAKRLCKPAACALFVVNAFIPLERIAKKHFKRQQLLANNGHFKLFKLHN